jgi:amino-acid N-acetyltransferase
MATIRSAEARDHALICALLESVGLPVEGVADHLHDFIVLVEAGEVIGTGGLEVYGQEALLRSLAVSGAQQGRGHGQRLYTTLIDNARVQDVSVVYLLTETAEDFFAALGFERIVREEAGDAVKASAEFRYICPESAACMRLSL